MNLHFFFLNSPLYHLKVSTRKLEDFTDTLSVFAKKFNLHGPGAVGDDLEKGRKTMMSKIINLSFMTSLFSSFLIYFIFSAGLAMMQEFEAELALVVGAQQDLANVANLLDLQVKVFPELIHIQKDMSGLRLIYDLYKAQKVCTAVSIMAIYF